MEASQQPPAMPTPQDVQAIFDRATQAAERAETAAQALEAARTAAGTETQERFPGMPAELVKQISDASAKAVLEGLNKQFEVTAPPPAAPPEAGVESESGGGEQASGSSATPAPGSDYRNLAHRILGY